MNSIIVELEKVEVGGYIVNATVEVHIEDRGIGPYEFWGAKGVHHDYGPGEYNIVKASFEEGQEDLPSDAVQFLNDVLDKNIPEENRFFEYLDDAYQKVETEDEYDEGWNE